MLPAMTAGSGQQVAPLVRRARLVRGRWWNLAAGVGVLAVVGVFALTLAGVEMPTEAPVAWWHQDAALALLILAAALLVVGAVRVMRMRVVASSGWVDAAASTRAERASALGAVRRLRAVGRGEQELTVAVARAAIGEGASTLLCVSVALSVLSSALGTAPSWWQLAMVAAVVSLGVMAAITAGDARQARRWLAAHLDPDPGAIGVER